MSYLFCATLLSAVLLGAHGYPAEPAEDQEPQVVSGLKQTKQSLFGSAIDVNLNHNGTLIPVPSFINFNTSIDDTIGGTASFVLPLVPFPFGLIFPRYPPLNLSLGFTAGKNMSIGLNAAAGENATNWNGPAPGWNSPAPGWSTPAPGWNSPSPAPGWSTPAPGWSSPSPAPGWSTPAPAPTGWSSPAPSPAPAPIGWSSPAPSPAPAPIGWSSPAPSPAPAPSGWSSPAPSPAPVPSPGWSAPVVVPAPPGSGWKKAGPINLANNKPNLMAKPTASSLADAIATVNNAVNPDAQLGSVVMVENAVNSQAAALEHTAAAEGSHQEASQAEITNVLTAMDESETSPAASLVVPEAEAPEVVIPAAPEMPQDLSKSPAKSRRHAGVERPAALRIEDFEDVEVSPEMIAPGSPTSIEDMVQEASKEEMILLAMEQVHQIVPGMHLTVARPAPITPGFINQKPISYQPSKPVTVEDEDSEDNVRHSETPDFSLVGENGVIPKAPVPKPNSDLSGKNKPRPYGMDPAKNKGRPTLEGGLKEKEPQLPFGLPHYSSDYIHKEQMEGANPTVLGWQLPTIKWPSFTNLFQNILGNNRHKGKSDQVDAAFVLPNAQPCVDDEDEKDVRSKVIQGGQLCNGGAVASNCDEQCKKSGFASGTCLGPHPTPGCLCTPPRHKEYGLMLTPLTNKSSKDENLQTSDTAPCKKCGCIEACQKSGSYHGYCVSDRCHCAVPWYRKVEE